MKVTVEWHNDQFNVNVASAEGRDPFISIKGCRIANGSKGEFVSWPATKNANSGKWWNHVWGSEQFNDVVLSTARASQPQRSQRQAPRRDEADSDIPF